MTRFIRRTIAPLVAGALTAGVLVAAADAADLSPFHGVLTQSEDTVPADQLDLDELIAEGTDYDTDTVFVPLHAVGDFFGQYAYGAERGVENVAAELELMLAGSDDPDGEGPVVSERDAARTYLLDEQCNGLLSLAVRKQVSRPLLATILRPDEQLIEELKGGEDETEPAARAAGRGQVIGTDPLTGEEVITPIESTVQIGTVTVSVLDLDLIRARPQALLSDLLSGEARLGLEGEVSPDSVGIPEFYDQVWRDCLAIAAEEDTVAARHTLRGQQVWSLKKDPDPALDPSLVLDTSVVTWLEDDIEVRVETTFENVADGIAVDPAVDLDTRAWLATHADPVEPGLEVASQIVGRRLDVLDLLVAEAFAQPSGWVFGDEIAGQESAVRARLRGIVTPQPTDEEELLQDAAEAAVDAFGLSFEAAVDEVVARPFFRPGQIERNVRRRFADPPQIADQIPAAIAQAVVWDPSVLNSDAFRDGWAAGIVDASARVTDLEALVADGVIDEETAGDLGVVDLVFSEAEGVMRIDYLTPCYSVTVSAPTVGVLESTVNALVDAQASRRHDVFGPRVDPFETDGPLLDTADLDYSLRRLLFERQKAEVERERAEGPDVRGPALEDLRFDHLIAAELFERQRQATLDAAARERRATADAERAAFCSRNNLALYAGGRAPEDLDGNRIADSLPENEVTLVRPDDEDGAG